MDILCWRWNADLKVEFEDLSRQMSELSSFQPGCVEASVDRLHLCRLQQKRKHR